jgi:hypothetical protein
VCKVMSFAATQPKEILSKFVPATARMEAVLTCCILSIVSYTVSKTVAYAREMKFRSHQYGVICGLSGGM